MRYLRKRSRPEVRAAENGFLELANRKADLPIRDALLSFRDLVSADMIWVHNRKSRFRRRAAIIRIIAVTLTAVSTVVLGIQAIPERASIALPMVAMVTVLGTLENFFSWRSRWALMEEAQYRLNRLRDEMDYYIVTTPSVNLERDRLNKFFGEQQEIWADVSRRWVEFRKIDRFSQGNGSSGNINPVAAGHRDPSW